MKTARVGDKVTAYNQTYTIGEDPVSGILGVKRLMGHRVP